MSDHEHWKAMAAMNDLMPMWSDELLGKLLAWATATGFLPCTTQEPMLTVIMIAGKRFNVQGGEVPNKERLQKYFYPRLREIKQHKAATPWLPELMERYKVRDWRQLDYSWAEDIATPAVERFASALDKRRGPKPEAGARKRQWWKEHKHE